MDLRKGTNKNNIEKLIKYFLDELDPNGTGITVNSLNGITIDELCSSYNDVLSKFDAIESIRLMIKNRETDLNTFEEFYKEKLKEKENSKLKTSMWTIYYPIYIKIEDDVKLPFTISVDGIKFIFQSSLPFPKRFAKNFPHNLYDYEKNVKNHIFNHKLFVKVLGIDNSWHKLAKKVSSAFNILRGIIQFTNDFRGYHWGGSGKPLSKIPHPAWALVKDSANSYEGIRFLYDEFVPTFPFKLTSKGLETSRKNSLLLRNKAEDKSSAKLLADSLDLYIEAMDEKYLSNRFIRLWQAAELLTLAHEAYGNTERTAKRLSWFGQGIGLIASGYANILLNLADKRNELIHTGISNISDDDINNIKFAIDNTLLWYFRNIKKLSTRAHISNYYNLRAKNSKELKIITECIDYLK